MTDSTARFDEIDARLNALNEATAEMREQLAQNTAVITGLQRATSELLAIAQLHQQALRVAQQDAERDRLEFREEIRRIWEYLLRQQPNGHGDNPS
jgi:hypothetical protein